MAQTGRMDRDRDPAGRPRNARPRDELGRPLPYGTHGVPRQPEGHVRTPEQTLDEARHHEMFASRLAQSTAASGTRAAGDEILIPPLRKFIDLCYEVADRGAFVDGLVLTNLVLEGMAYPLYGYEERYWKPVDPYLARLIASAFADETRHVAFGAALVGAALGDDPAARARVQRLTNDARRVELREVRLVLRGFGEP